MRNAELKFSHVCVVLALQADGGQWRAIWQRVHRCVSCMLLQPGSAPCGVRSRVGEQKCQDQQFARKYHNKALAAQSQRCGERSCLPQECTRCGVSMAGCLPDVCTANAKVEQSPRCARDWRGSDGFQRPLSAEYTCLCLCQCPIAIISSAFNGSVRIAQTLLVLRYSRTSAAFRTAFCGDRCRWLSDEHYRAAHCPPYSQQVQSHAFLAACRGLFCCLLVTRPRSHAFRVLSQGVVR